MLWVDGQRHADRRVPHHRDCGVGFLFKQKKAILMQSEGEKEWS